MSRMLREVLRWRGHARRALPSEQWTNWAASFAARHAGLFSSNRAPAMTLALPVAPLFLRSQRWEHHVWNLFPQIKLAIGPVLREIVWKASATKDFLGLDPSRNWRTAAVQGDAAITEGDAHGRSAARFAAEERAQTSASARPSMIDLLKAGERESLTEPARVVGRTTADWPQPLSRVLGRMKAYETQGLSSQKWPTKESLQLVERVTRERERIEQAVERRSVGRQPVKEVSAAELERVFRKSSPSRAGSASDEPDARDRGPQTGPPAINIAELTEQVMRQIDSQIVAQRERVGKSF